MTVPSNSATLILGGARSGKSRRAQSLAEEAGANRIFIATAEPLDEEMRERIFRHQADRAQGWSTVEAPLALVEALSSERASNADVCLVDCLTLWLSNMLHSAQNIEKETDRLCEVIAVPNIPLFLVSNEVGLGLVPETPIGRKFRDAQGRLNQKVAQVCNRVEFVAAGLPIRLKG